MTDIEALEEAAKKATPGSWSHEATTFSKTDRILYSNRSGTMHGLNLMTLADGDWNHVNNVEFIALANPSAILSLISTIREQRSRADAAEAELATLRARAEKTERLLFTLSSVAGSVLIGASIHNSRNAGDKIEGPLITALAEATRAARAALKGGE